jgi:hypothetical protein
VRRVLIVLAILVVILVAADFGLKAFAQDQVGKQIQTSLDLERRPGVSLGGFPFLYHLLAGSFPTIHVDAPKVDSGGVHIDDVQLDLEDVEFSPRRLLGGDPTSITSRGGSGAAEITGENVTQALQDRGIEASVRFADGKAFVSSSRLPGPEVQARVALVEGRLTFTNDALPGLSVSVALPEVVQGLHYTSATIDGSTGLVRFELTASTLELPS